jgi:hypothetical protein
MCGTKWEKERKRCHNTSFTESGFVADNVHRIYIRGIPKRDEKFIEMLDGKTRWKGTAGKILV